MPFFLNRWKNHPQIGQSRVYLYEAVCRVMAGASPGATQQLLDRSLRHRHARSSIICGGSNSGNGSGAKNGGGKRQRNNDDNNGGGGGVGAKNPDNNCDDGQTSANAGANNVSGSSGPRWEGGGERERAAAMYVACKYLPSALLSSPGERVGMLAEAAKTLEKIGDRRQLNDCYRLMKSLSGSGSTSTTH